MLTDLLLPRARRVIGIELDRVLAAQLRMRYATRPNVEILESDFVTAEFASMVGREPGPLHDLRPTQPETVDVVGNLPYYITSDIVLRILELHQNIERAVIMVQREVADRIAASRAAATTDCSRPRRSCLPGSRSCSRFRRERSRRRRKVHSGVLRLTMAPRLEELQVQEEPFIAFLKLAFAQKRKTLLNNLRGQYADAAVRAALKAAGLRADVRAEAVPLEKMAAVFRALQQA